MVLSDTTTAHASAMGARAGEAWRATGIPERNPFDQNERPKLAQAWRAAYLKAGAAPPGV